MLFLIEEFSSGAASIVTIMFETPPVCSLKCFDRCLTLWSGLNINTKDVSVLIKKTPDMEANTRTMNTIRTTYLYFMVKVVVLLISLSMKVLLKSVKPINFFFTLFCGNMTKIAGIKVMDKTTDMITPIPAKIPKVFKCMILFPTKETRETKVVSPAIAIVVSIWDIELAIFSLLLL